MIKFIIGYLIIGFIINLILLYYKKNANEFQNIIIDLFIDLIFWPYIIYKAFIDKKEEK
jgi:hypothetical protein